MLCFAPSKMSSSSAQCVFVCIGAVIVLSLFFCQSAIMQKRGGISIYIKSKTLNQAAHLIYMRFEKDWRETEREVSPYAQFFLFPNPKVVHRLKAPGLCCFPLSSPSHPVIEAFSSGRTRRYLLTLPASESSSSWNLGRRAASERMQSGTNLTRNPRTPRLAASIAAYSSLRVESDVQ